MQPRAFVLAAAFGGALLLVACSDQLPSSPTALDGSSASSASGGPSALAASVSAAPTRVFPTGELLSGTSSLVRNDSGISMTVRADGLTPHHVYTVWIVAFNEPAGCTDGVCDVQDVLNNRGLPAVRYAAGHLIGESGQANFGGHLAEGNTGGAPCAPGPGLGSCGPGLLDARTAIVHLVLRTHGPGIPGILNEQISSFNGGCPPNTCANVQFAEHLPNP